MSAKNTAGANRLKASMEQMIGVTVPHSHMAVSTKDRQDGFLYEVWSRIADKPDECLIVNQGYGKKQFSGFLTFSFTLSQLACVDGYQALEKITGESFVNGNRGLSMHQTLVTRTNNDQRLDDIIKYLENVFPKVSQALLPERNVDGG